MADNISTKSRPKLPFLTRLKLLILGLVRHVYIRRDGTINRRVLRLLDSKASAPATKLIKGTRVSTSDVPIDPSRELWFRLFVPADGGSGKLLPLIVYFHGGGFTNFGPDSQSFDDLCSRLAAEAPRCRRLRELPTGSRAPVPLSI
ncbi:putative carboxylesterase 18 [Sesamum angolense]|uniref:Carboxylesterase 18 n=1 Tax=Sesamum angolense TaxID=2727404 RepID=A0AAE1W2A7_9LAMI|nr:putative carboxylesterase 18 [Sesamum angolense]